MRDIDEIVQQACQPDFPGRFRAALAVCIASSLGLAAFVLPQPGISSLGVSEAAASESGPTTVELPVRGPGRDLSSRIVGGTNVKSGWQVALGYGNKNLYRGQFCGGTLIAPDLVLTAAHCVLSDKTKDIDPELQRHGIKLVVGRPRLSDVGGELRWTEIVGSWPNEYKPNRGLVWDVALLKASEPFTVGEPIKLAGPDEGPLWSEGRPVWPSGWGEMRKGLLPDHLRGTWLTMFSDRFCRAYWGRGGLDSQTQFCAGSSPLSGRGICSGDSGGPVVASSNSGVVRLVGVTSFGPRKCGSSVPDGFAKVASDPIRSEIADFARELNPEADVVGTGESTPPAIDRFDAKANAGLFVDSVCFRIRTCFATRVRQCLKEGQGAFRCRVSRYHFGKRSLWTSSVSLRVSDDGSRILRQSIGSWKRVKGLR